MGTRLLSCHPSNMHAQMEKAAAICLIEGGTQVEGEGIYHSANAIVCIHRYYLGNWSALHRRPCSAGFKRCASSEDRLVHNFEIVCQK